MDKDLITKDKAIFVVGLMSAFLAFSSFKEELRNIKIQIGTSTPTLYFLFLVFIVVLSLATYFYALGCLKYNYPRFQNSFVFKIFIFLGNLLYSAGLLFPLLVFILFIAPIIPVPPTWILNWIVSFDIISGAILLVLSIKNAIASGQLRKKYDIEKIDEAKITTLERASKLLESKFNSEASIEAYKVVEISLREKLLKKVGIYTEGLSPSRITDFAIKNKIINEETAKKIRELQKVRNSAVHTNLAIDYVTASKLLKDVQMILEDIEKSNPYQPEEDLKSAK